MAQKSTIAPLQYAPPLGTGSAERFVTRDTHITHGGHGGEGKRQIQVNINVGIPYAALGVLD